MVPVIYTRQLVSQYNVFLEMLSTQPSNLDSVLGAAIHLVDFGQTNFSVTFLTFILGFNEIPRL